MTRIDQSGDSDDLPEDFLREEEVARRDQFLDDLRYQTAVALIKYLAASHPRHQVGGDGSDSNPLRSLTKVWVHSVKEEGDSLVVKVSGALSGHTGRIEQTYVEYGVTPSGILINSMFTESKDHQRPHWDAAMDYLYTKW